MATIDDDVIIESVSNSPKPQSKCDTPVSSNPGTPRAADCSTPPVIKPTVHQPLPAIQQPQTKYGSLLAVIEDLGKDIRPTYAGNRTSAERLKRGIVQARILVRECLMECERNART